MSRKSALTLNLLRGALIALAIGCIFAGVARGEVDVVLRKAIRICLECIGVAG